MKSHQNSVISKKKEKLEEIGKVIKGEFTPPDEAVVGENRGQLLVRIPKAVEKQLGLKKGQTLVFKPVISGTTTTYFLEVKDAT